VLCLKKSSKQPEKEEMEDLVYHMQQLFFSLTSTTNAAANEKQFSCPVQCFLAACSYNRDDTFKSPKGMTSMLAQWQFMLRATALLAADLSTKGGDSNSVFRYDRPSSLPNTTC
jgi:hypothetical protein